MKVAIVSLGCPKNQVDADVYCRSLIQAGHETVAEMQHADVIFINTCGFIDSAKEEAIENILHACSYKNERPNVKVVVTGCLAERYKAEVLKEIPEVDAVVGIGSNANLPELLASWEQQAPTLPVLQCGPKTDLALGGARVIGTPRHYAWLKIAEGCSHCCSYCAIPLIRGPLRSRPLKECVDEATWLAEQGVREIVLVAQDVTAYGDETGENKIAALLDALNQVEGIHWIRILYAYPERITEEFADAMLRNDKVVHYLDLPIQHIDDEILASMKRKGDSSCIRNALKLLREKMPDITLRTSLIAGYPGETPKQFELMCEFVLEAQFDRLGCFPYSPEDGTPAAKYPNQVPKEERERRAEILMLAQSRISEEKQALMLGKTLEVVCDSFDEEIEAWLCRSAADAPEVDANVIVHGDAPMQVGQFYLVEITLTDIYDLHGKYISDAK